MTAEQQMVLDAARDWTIERTPADRDEKALFVAVARCFPADFVGKEQCTCGEQDGCDECPTTAQIEAAVAAMEKEILP
jgi:hypothetical protein